MVAHCGLWYALLLCTGLSVIEVWPRLPRFRDRLGVAVGPRAWQCGNWLTRVFSQEHLHLYGYRIRRGFGRVKPLCIFSILSRMWVHGEDSVQQLSVSWRGSGCTCLTVWELTDLGVFTRISIIMGIVYIWVLGVWSPCVYIFHIIPDLDNWS